MCLGVGEILAVVALLLASLIGLVPIKCKCKCNHENSVEV